MCRIRDERRGVWNARGTFLPFRSFIRYYVGINNTRFDFVYVHLYLSALYPLFTFLPCWWVVGGWVVVGGTNSYDKGRKEKGRTEKEERKAGRKESRKGGAKEGRDRGKDKEERGEGRKEGRKER